MYGLTAVIWRFWQWKSLFALQYALKRKRQWYFIIANNPWSFVDMFISSTEDFKKFITRMIEIYEKSNKKLQLKYPGILIVLDESHIYFNSRDFGKWTTEYSIFFSQLRKRNIEILLITQNMQTVDKNLRRYVNFVFEPKKFLGVRFYTIREVLDPEECNIYDSEQEWKKWVYIMWPISSFLFNFYVITDKVLKERKISHYICWYKDTVYGIDKLVNFIKKNWFK